jgi:uncharacterized SAM-binding protein YcdF (DUF218 family)
VPDADLIFVLAGLEARKAYGLELWRQHGAGAILFSVGRFEIRKFSKLDLPASIDLLEAAKPIPPPQRHFFVSFGVDGWPVKQIRIGRFGTWSEIEALALWLGRRYRVRSLVVVSSAYHLYRVRICCRALLPERVHVEYRASPDEDRNGNRRPWSKDFRHHQTRLAELIKIPAYWLLALPYSLRARS